MKSLLHSNLPLTPELLTFPGIFKSHPTGSIWLAKTPSVAMRLHVGTATAEDDAEVADTISTCEHTTIEAVHFTQIKGPVNITFLP